MALNPKNISLYNEEIAGILVQHALQNKRWLAIKRLTDLVIGVPCLIVAIPLVLMIAILIWLDSPGNPFFLQIREGRSRKPFVLFKFRTLYLEHFGSLPDDEIPSPHRVTRTGKFLRRSKLDELPQLLNVVLGQMSLVGPRPYIPYYIPYQEFYTTEQLQRLILKPGLTGIAQISGNVMLSWDERILLDLWYINNWSWLLDIKISALTFIAIYKGESIYTDPFNLRGNLQR